MCGGAEDGFIKIHQPGCSGGRRGWGWGSIGGDMVGGVEGGGGWGCLQSRSRHLVLRDAEKRGEGGEFNSERSDPIIPTVVAYVITPL